MVFPSKNLPYPTVIHKLWFSCHLIHSSHQSRHSTWPNPNPSPPHSSPSLYPHNATQRNSTTRTPISSTGTTTMAFALFSTLTTPSSSSSSAAVAPPRSFQGLRRLPACKPLVSLPRRRKSASVAVKAELNPSVVISLSTGLSLFLGRFVFFNFQRDNMAKQVPAQNGKTHFDAGDERAKEFANVLKSNDPVGFNIVDVLAWGSIGHIVAYYILATSSNGYHPEFFG